MISAVELAHEGVTTEATPLPAELRPFEYVLGRFEGGIEVYAADQMATLAFATINGSPVLSLKELVMALRLRDARTLAQNPLDKGWYEERFQQDIMTRYRDYHAYRQVIVKPDSVQANTDKYWDDMRTGERAIKATWSFPDSFNEEPIFTRCQLFEQPGDPQHPESTYLQTYFDIMPNRFTLLFTLRGQPVGEDTSEFVATTVGGTYALDGSPIRTIG